MHSSHLSLDFTVLFLVLDNVKALYRRAKANAAVWRTDEAKTDYQRVCDLDPSLENKVNSELRLLDIAIKKKDAEDRQKLQGKLFT